MEFGGDAVRGLSVVVPSSFSAEWYQCFKGSASAHPSANHSTSGRTKANLQPWTPPFTELSAYERKMMIRLERASRRGAYETNGVPVPDNLLLPGEIKTSAVKAQAEKCIVAEEKAEDCRCRSPVRSLGHGLVKLDVVEVASAVAYAYWTRAGPFFRVCDLVNCNEFVTEPVPDVDWRSRAIACPDAAEEDVGSFWPASADRVFSREMRRDLFWHLACGTSSSREGAYALGMVLVRCVDQSAVLHAGGRAVGNVAICFAHLPQAPASRILVDNATGLRRRSCGSFADDSWSSPSLGAQYGMAPVAADEPELPLEDGASTPFWWVSLCTERPTADASSSGELVRAGASHAPPGQGRATDAQHCSVEGHDGVLRNVQVVDRFSVMPRMVHVGFHGPAHGFFEYHRTTHNGEGSAITLPLFAFESPQATIDKPQNDGAPFPLRNLEATPRFLRRVETAWFTPARHLLASRRFNSAEVCSDFASFVIPCFERLGLPAKSACSKVAKQALTYEETLATIGHRP